MHFFGGGNFECQPECDVVILPFEVSREVVVLPDVRDAASGQSHKLHRAVIQIPCHLEMNTINKLVIFNKSVL